MSLLQLNLEKSRAAKAALLSQTEGANSLVSQNDNTNIDMNDIAARLEQKLQSVERNELETLPRDTVLRMLVQKKMDEQFSFKVDLDRGENYIQAMRQVLSRARKKALKKKQRLDEFKLYVISITHEKDHDVVIVVRTRQLNAQEMSVYDDIINAYAKA